MRLNAQKHTPSHDEDFTKPQYKVKLEVNGAGLCGVGVVAQLQLFPAQGMLYSLALMYNPLPSRCNVMA
jgi:hypothetical protein